VSRVEQSTCGYRKKEIIDLSAMSPDHQVDEQLIGGFIHVATDPQSLPQLSGV